MGTMSSIRVCVFLGVVFAASSCADRADCGAGPPTGVSADIVIDVEPGRSLITFASNGRDTGQLAPSGTVYLSRPVCSGEPCELVLNGLALRGLFFDGSGQALDE